MKKKPTKQERQQNKQNRKLAWVLSEWDCLNLEEAKQEALKDSTLHRLLRECGIQFPINNQQVAMKKFAIAARDPQTDIYSYDDFYGLEVVEAENEKSAMDLSICFNPSNGLDGLHTYIYQVDDATEIGWHETLLPAKIE